MLYNVDSKYNSKGEMFLASIRQRGDNTYQFVVSLKGADGKFFRRYKTYRVKGKFTPKQLEKHLNNEAFKFEEEVKSNNYIEPSNISFDKFSVKWIKFLEDDAMSENTLALRIGSLNNHILPILGQLKMKEITTLMLIDLMKNLERKDGRSGELSISAKQEVYKALASIFIKAGDWKVVQENPMIGVDYPKSKKTNKVESLNVYSESEIKNLLLLLKDEQPHWRIFITLAFTTGMRRGELLGLKWEHVDLKNGVIKIRQIVSKTRVGTEVKEPKYNSIRNVSISQSIISDLKKYKKHSEDEFDLLGIENNGWVFFNNEGSYFYPDTPTLWWRRFVKRKKMRFIRLHDLRHTSATLLVAKNVHAKIISERLGHAKIATTMDTYGHVSPATDKEASDKLEDILNV